MAQPSTRTELIEYCLRQLGAPVIEVNLAEEQIEDLVDDAIQFFQERHFNGVIQTYLKYEITEDDINRARGPGSSKVIEVSTETATADIVGNPTTFTFKENNNFIQVPPSVIGINKVWQYDGVYAMEGSGMFNIKYQMFLNDIYYWGNLDLLSYDMAMTYLETMNFLLNTHKQIRFNQRQDRLYLDVNPNTLNKGEYLIIDCWRAMDPNDYPRVWNDSFLKPYLTALMKRQWGQNLIKFQGVKLPGGIEFNGRQLYDDAQLELDKIAERMLSTYEIPPLDLIG